jgi:hypothetical protein
MKFTCLHPFFLLYVYMKDTGKHNRGDTSRGIRPLAAIRPLTASPTPSQSSSLKIENQCSSHRGLNLLAHEPDIENQCSSHRGLNLLAHEPDIENQCSSHRGLNLLAHEPDMLNRSTKLKEKRSVFQPWRILALLAHEPGMPNQNPSLKTQLLGTQA